MKINMCTLIAEAGITDMSGKGPDGEENCICCNRSMSEKAIEKSVWMHTTTDGCFVPFDSDDLEDSQGCFVIGASCASKISKTLKLRGLNPKLWISKRV
jgi:hypothetical protein